MSSASARKVVTELAATYTSIEVTPASDSSTCSGVTAAVVSAPTDLNMINVRTPRRQISRAGSRITLAKDVMITTRRNVVWQSPSRVSAGPQAHTAALAAEARLLVK